MKTRNDLVTRALRQASVVAMDEVPTASEYQNASDVMDGILTEIGQPFTGDTIPDAAFVALANWLAKEVAPGFGMTDQERARAKLRLAASIAVDDRANEPTSGFYF